MNRDIYQTITQRFIEQLKRGTVPWQKPWFAVQNIVSRKPYRGINAFLLGSADYQAPLSLRRRECFPFRYVRVPAPREREVIGDAIRDAMKSRAPSSGVLTVSPLNDRLIIQ